MWSLFLPENWKVSESPLIKVITCQTHECAMISSVLTDSPLWPTVGVVSELPLESPREVNEEMSLRLFYT